MNTSLKIIPPQKPVINHLCSLGTLCQSSWFLKSYNYKLESYPFDWIFSSPIIIKNILEDNFKSFLDRTLYINHTNSNSNNCGHKIYGPRMFQHHNPRKNENYNYYKRCVDRFRTLLNTKKNKLFVLTFPNRKLINFNAAKQSVIQLNNTLKKYTKNYYIFVVYNVINNITKHNIIINDNISFCILHTKSMSTGLNFRNNQDNNYLNRIIRKRYDIKLTKLI